MEIVRLNVADLVLNDKNVRKHNGTQIIEFGRALKQFGQIRPVVIDENNVVWCGNGLVTAAKQIGMEVLDCIVKRGLTDKQKKKLMMSDNKIFQLGGDDYAMIDKLMEELEGDFDIPGYDSSVLEDMYGASSAAIEAQRTAQAASFIPVPTPSANGPEAVVSDSDWKVPEHKQVYENVAVEREKVEQQLQNERYIICPNCGKRIDIT